MADEIVATTRADERPAPPGFEPLSSGSPFINNAGRFHIGGHADGSSSIGTWIGDRQGNADGAAHGGFLLAFADFALSRVTNGITLNLSFDFMRPARIGDWIEACVTVRKQSATLVFADATFESGGMVIGRATGLFRPFVPPS